MSSVKNSNKRKRHEVYSSSEEYDQTSSSDESSLFLEIANNSSFVKKNLNAQ